ncbi:glycoside hydrolase [Sinomicrobium kalidii]|uniref:TolB family protein n=1 Tax=Sinomicrobium kalidii TaxID=2900738 RepID=UPI001E4CA723|nr:sialidase family protein [Sinomicrobium kalidii]UGU15884.1 glycoside hydrolase [Sinomicrobium kalidii]
MAVVIVLWIILYACSTSSDNKKYLGQAPHSLKPEVFAPGLISKKGESEFGSVFNKEANQFYYGADINGRSEIRFTTLEKETWGPPQTLLSNEKYSCNDPFLSPDEQRLYFISNRAVDGLGTKDDYDIWYIERNGNTWNTKMINAGPQINSGKNEYYMSFTTNGDMYFSSNTMASEKREHNYDIYVSGYGKGIFQKPNVLSNSINTEAYETDVFVAPDESYIIFCSIRRDGYGKGNLYISFREDGGNWSEAKNMGPQINTKDHELCQFVTKDGKYFFYTGNQDIYWVDAGIINNLKD